MKKRVFSYEKWANDSDTQAILFDEAFDDEFREYMNKRMESLDGRTVVFKTGCDHVFEWDDKGLLTMIHIDWTEPVESSSWKETFLMGAGIGLAIYGLAMLCVTIADILKGVV